jgi:hypothetical protein
MRGSSCLDGSIVPVGCCGIDGERKVKSFQPGFIMMGNSYKQSKGNMGNGDQWGAIDMKYDPELGKWRELVN